MPSAVATTLPRRGSTGAADLLLVGWTLNLILTPFYVVESGNPQPADALMAVLILLVLGGMIGRLPPYTALYIVLGLLVLEVALVNLTWFGLYYRTGFIKSASYYLYNALIVVFIVSAMWRAPERALRATQIGLFVAVAVQLAIIMFGGGGGFRNSGSFNNPNQLGYWGLLMLACWLVARGHRQLGALDLCFYGAVANIVLASLSKAAIISLGAISLIALFAHGLRGRWLAGTLALALVGAQLYVILPPSWQDQAADLLTPQVMAEKLTKRFDSLGRHDDDSLVGRGYDRIWNHPQYALFGAGEGHPGRFTGPDAGFNELHSSWGTLLFSYGVLGVALFVALLVVVFRHALLRHVLYFIPIALYGLTHQGIRFSTFWVFLGLVYGFAQWRRSRQRTGGAVRHAARAGPPALAGGRAAES